MDQENEFMSEQEIEEYLDSMMTEIADEIVKDESRASMINLKKLKQIEFACKALRYLTIESGAKVLCELHEPFNSIGYVSVIGKNISFSNPNLFIRISNLASNVEVYPKTDGTVQMNFTFHGLTFPIE